ncbi:unnamed protein product [Amoebophrya sp. A120]|nr:unnamed protein product [Amoebophrya sp. A120]|eukprot:GSA120T00011894001.1
MKKLQWPLFGDKNGKSSIEVYHHGRVEAEVKIKPDCSHEDQHDGAWRFGYDYKRSKPDRNNRPTWESLQKEKIAIVRNVIPRHVLEEARNAIGDTDGLLSRIDVQQSDEVLGVLENENLVKCVRSMLEIVQNDKEQEERNAVAAHCAEGKDEPRAVEPEGAVVVEPRNKTTAQSEKVLETTSYKWLRCVKELKYTGLHRDFFYLQNDKYYTVWIPFLPRTELQHGALVWQSLMSEEEKKEERDSKSERVAAMPEISEQNKATNIITDVEQGVGDASSTTSEGPAPTSAAKRESICSPEKPTVKKRKVLEEDAPASGGGEEVDPVKTTDESAAQQSNGTTSGWLCLDASEYEHPEGFCWRSTDFEAGDIAIFDMSLLHMTVPNLSAVNRISCDTRWRLRRRDVCAADIETEKEPKALGWKEVPYESVIPED